MFKKCMLLFLSSLLLLTGCKKQSEPISQTGFYFDTVITITLYDTKDYSLLKQCFSLCEKYENMLSKTVKGSDVWNINHANGKPIVVSKETASLIQKALTYSTITNGAIDITIAPVDALWNFSSGATTHEVPAKKAIEAGLSHVNYKHISIKKNTIQIADKDAAIDLGFIAKGYIADQLKAYLVKQGVKSAIINLGGNVVTIGNKPDQTPFQIGIQKPFDTQNTPIASLPVSDCSLVSSGVYERYFKENGKLYHHILNAKTGYPVDNDLYGVTILSPLSVDGDGLSTTCFVLGLKKGMAYIESLPNTEAIFITNDYKLHYTSGLKDN